MPVEWGGDVSIVAIEMTKNQRTLNTFYDGFGGGWRPNPGADETVNVPYDIGGRRER